MKNFTQICLALVVLQVTLVYAARIPRLFRKSFSGYNSEEYGYDCPDNTIESFRRPRKCAKKCNRNAECVAFVITKFDGGKKCHLKSVCEDPIPQNKARIYRKVGVTSCSDTSMDAYIRPFGDDNFDGRVYLRDHGDKVECVFTCTDGVCALNVDFDPTTTCGGATDNANDPNIKEVYIVVQYNSFFITSLDQLVTLRCNVIQPGAPVSSSATAIEGPSAIVPNHLLLPE